MTPAANFPFHGQSRKHDDTDKISHSNSFRIFQFSSMHKVYFRFHINKMYFSENVMITCGLPHGCTKPKRMTLRQKMANLELNIELVIRVESFTLEETNELCTRIGFGWGYVTAYIGVKSCIYPLRGEKLNYKSVAKEISKPPFFGS